MLRLVYVSTRTLNFTDDSIEAACANFSRFNDANGITGLLLVSELNFMQVLEGAVDEIRALYRRISSDVRHSNVQTVLEEVNAPARCFPDWGMRWLPAPLRKPQVVEVVPPTAPSKVLELVSNFGL